MNTTELRNWIRRELGAPIVRIELTDQQIDDALGIAIDKYLYYKRPNEDYYYFNTSAGRHNYGPADFTDFKESVQSFSDLPESGNMANDVRLVYDEDKYYTWAISESQYQWILYDPGTTIPIDVLTTVREVVYQPTLDIINQLIQAQSDFFLAYYYRRSGGMFIADLWIAMSAKESFNMILGLDPTWEVLNNKLYLYPTPQAAIKVGLKYQIMPTEEQLASAEWVQKATLARAKQTLGRIRSKYGSIPGPGGTEIALDGATLLQEGAQEWEWLISDLVGRSEPLSFSIG